MALRVALFVEGSENRAIRRGPLLATMWIQLAGALGITAFSRVEPISKKHLVAMDPALVTMSGAGEALDQLMARCLEREPFDAAVVAWDLVPPKDADAGFCRWKETLDLYRLVGESHALPEPWRTAATRRHREMASRALPRQRRAPHRVASNEIVAVCMDPMFEALLLQSEQHVLRALEVVHRPPGWPARGWGSSTTRQLDRDVLKPMIDAFDALPRKQRPRVAKTLRTDARNKDPWLEYLLRRLLEDPEARAIVLAHPICRRLRECLAPP
jgi:hypothetical protein